MECVFVECVFMTLHYLLWTMELACSGNATGGFGAGAFSLPAQRRAMEYCELLC